LLGRFRERYENAMLPLGRAVGSLGISPNMLSVFAAILGALASLWYVRGIALLGALVLLVSTFFDMLDGAVARATKTSSRFGSVLDHVLDRYVEYALVIGIVAGGFADWFWGIFALIGMLLASYTRAAAESVGGLSSCTVGIAERQEKLLLILVGSVLVPVWPSALQYAMILVGLLSHGTVIQRLVYTRQNARGFRNDL
jgi:CDP-diacylglycerol--glycerol-3-phosphate 3-phosphatidyltransferase/archaetidylinositol phosphate synthase